jgi:hypothetical protein
MLPYAESLKNAEFGRHSPTGNWPRKEDARLCANCFAAQPGDRLGVCWVVVRRLPPAVTRNKTAWGEEGFALGKKFPRTHTRI